MKKADSILFPVILLAAACGAVSAQTEHASPDAATDNHIIIRSDTGILPVLPLMSDPVTNAELFNEKIVKNSPLTAQFRSETIRVLPGNNSQNNHSQLVNRVTVLFYRDKDGRTRREQTINTTGAATIGAAIEIYDPVSGYGYTLYPATQTAYKYRNPANQQRPVPAWDKIPQHIELTSSGGGSNNQSTKFNLAPPRVEALGNRMIQGAQTVGKRFTTIIPMNAAGNPSEVETTHEIWYAPGLKMLVQSSTQNPQFGRHTFQMTSLSQIEPAAALFRVPPDYRVVEMGASITGASPDPE